MFSTLTSSPSDVFHNNNKLIVPNGHILEQDDDGDFSSEEEKGEEKLYAAKPAENGHVVPIAAPKKTKKKIRRSKFQRALADITLDVSTISSYVSILLFLNSARNFPVIQHKVLAALNKSIYYQCTLHPTVITAIALEAATVGTEASSYTTALVGISLALFGVDAMYQLLRQHLKIPVFANSWKKITAQTAWFGEEVALYRVPIISIACIPGLALMFVEAIKLERDINCDISTLVTDYCAPIDQYNIMSLEIYLWMLASFPIIGFHALAHFSNIATMLPPLQATRSWYYQKIHLPFEKWTRSEKWLYRDIAWDFFSIPSMISIMAFAFVRSEMLVNDYSEQAGCGSVWDVLGSVIKGEEGDYHTCSTATKNVILSGFLGDLEVAKVYLFYTLAKVLCYGSVQLAEKFVDFQKHVSPQMAKKILDYFQKIHSNSTRAMMAMVGIVGCLQFYTAYRFSQFVLDEGLEIPFNVTNLINSTTAIPLNSTLGSMETLICPYANLTQLLPDWHNVTLNELNNTINDFSLYGNDTLLWRVADKCDGMSMFALYFLNFAGMESDCDIFVDVRALATFIGIFWMSVSIAAVMSYSSTSALQLIYKACQLCREFYRGAEPEAVVEEAIAYDDYIAEDWGVQLTQPSINNMADVLLPSAHSIEIESSERNIVSFGKRLKKGIYTFFYPEQSPGNPDIDEDDLNYSFRAT